MSNGNVNPPQLTGWQYVILQVAGMLISLASTIVAGCAAQYAVEARNRSEENQVKVKDLEHRVYDLQKNQRRVIGEPPPIPPDN